MKNELYKKVYIKSIDDLPKNYLILVGMKNGFQELVYIENGVTKKPFAYDEEDIPTMRIEKIDWYLQPIEQSEAMTDEEKTNLIQTRDLTDEEWLKLPKEEILKLYKNCYTMLNNLLQAEYIFLPNKEKLGESIYQIFKNTERIHGKSDAIDWVKVASYKTSGYVLSQIEAIDLELELKNFRCFITKTVPYSRTFEQEVKEYLKQRKI